MLRQTGTSLLSAAAKQSSSSRQKGLVVRYDANGAEKWAKLIGGDGENGLMDTVVKPDGNIVVAGWAASQSGTGTDGWIATLNPFGDLMNARFLGGRATTGLKALH